MPKTVKVAQGKEGVVQECLQGATPILILYYGDFCGHCQAMKPAWAMAKKELEKVKGLRVMEVEHSQQGALPMSLHMSMVPTLLVLKGRKVVREYDGDRSAPSIVAFGKAAAAVAPTLPKAAAARKRKSST